LNQLVVVYDALDLRNASKKTQAVWQNEELFKQVDILSRIRMILYYPIMLAMWQRKMSQAEMVQVMNKVIAIFVRHRMIRNETTNKLENGYARIAQQIYSGELSSVQAINDAMDKRLKQSDADVRASFSVLKKEGKQKGQKKWSLMYMLMELSDESIDLYEQAFQHSNKYQLVQVMDTGIDDEHLEYVANWAIIENGLADKLENTGSSEQRADIFAKSELITNHELANELRAGRWNEEGIQKRQDKLAQLATIVW
jgi:hypothetical protein